MTKLAAFWRNHCLGMFYGFLWAVVAILLQLSMSHGHPEITRTLCATFIAATIAGPAVTAIMRHRLKERTLGGALWRAPLSLLIGTVIFGLIIGQLEVLWRATQGTIPAGFTLTDPLLDSLIWPLMSFTFFAPLLIPLACLNTWHLWKQINKQTTLQQAAC